MIRGMSALDALGVQLPDREIQNGCEGNPCRQRHEAPARHPINPVESHDGCDDDQNLRNDVDKA